jgi:formylglycine-generating enzyme required for sulfatase activity
MRRSTLTWPNARAALLGFPLIFASSGALSGEPTPQLATSSDRLCTTYTGIPEGSGDKVGMVYISGGSFVMGSDRERPEEQFSHSVKVDGFWIDQHEVTNTQFEKFVEATGYKTLAERGVDPKTHPTMYGDVLAPGSMLFIQPTDVKFDLPR